MTKFLLIRHGETASVGRSLSGRLPGIPLNARGVEQAQALAAKLNVDVIYSSPLERAWETALIAGGGAEVRRRDAWLEIDFGRWTGLSFADLQRDSLWTAFNSERDTFRVPGGEAFHEVCARVSSDLVSLAGEHAGSSVAIVSHADVIRTALCWVSGIPLQAMFRWDVTPGSAWELIGGLAPGGRIHFSGNITRFA